MYSQLNLYTYIQLHLDTLLVTHVYIVKDFPIILNTQLHLHTSFVLQRTQLQLYTSSPAGLHAAPFALVHTAPVSDTARVLKTEVSLM